MSEAEQLDLDAEDQDQSATSTISRLSTSDDSETIIEETVTRTVQLENIRKEVSQWNRLVKMHKCNKIVRNNIMTNWGCL